MSVKPTTGRRTGPAEKRSLGRSPTESATLAGAARGPAGPAFVALPLPPNLKRKSASKPSVRGDERGEPRGGGGGCRGGSPPRILRPPRTYTPAGGGGARADAGISPRESPRGNAGWARARARWGRGPTPHSKRSHLRRRAGHEEIYREAEVTPLGAGVFGRTVHI